MDSVRKLRKAYGDIAGLAVGLNPDIPTYIVAQQRARGFEADILAFPSENSDTTPLQVLTAGDDFGKFFYMAGFDPIGDPHFPLGG